MRPQVAATGTPQDGAGASPSENQSTDDTAPAWITVQNETPAKLVIPGQGGRELVLAPLECRRLRVDRCAAFQESLERLEELRCLSAWPDEQERPNKALAFVALGF